MRTIINIPNRQIEELAAICAARELPRTEVIRQAIAAYIASQKLPSEDAFGLWKSQPEVGLSYQERMRSEW